MSKQSHALSAVVDGWLDRRGKLYPCKFNHHHQAAVKLMRELKLKHTPEYLGWVKVHSAGVWFFEADSYLGRQCIKVTESQNRWLLNNGYKVKQWD